MKTKTNKFKLITMLAAAFTVVSTSSTFATYVDFSTIAPGTPIPSLDGITFSLSGGPGPDGTPAAGSEYPGGIANTVNGNYPTAEDLVFSFSSPASVTSFAVNEWGVNADASFSAYNSANVLVGTGSLAAYGSEGLDTVNLANVSTLVFDNYYGSVGDNWQFDVNNITFTASAPESPSSLVDAMTLLLPFAAGAMRMLRKNRAA